jgi:hypothetical protein
MVRSHFAVWAQAILSMAMAMAMHVLHHALRNSNALKDNSLEELGL